MNTNQSKPDTNQITPLGDSIQALPYNDPQNTIPAASTQNVQPSEETANRIKNLAEVGTALFHSSDEVSFQTQFYAAKESLNRFKEGIDRLAIDDKSKNGMYDLINYLSKKIDRRLTSSEHDSAIPTI